MMPDRIFQSVEDKLNKLEESRLYERVKKLEVRQHINTGMIVDCMERFNNFDIKDLLKRLKKTEDCVFTDDSPSGTLFNKLVDRVKRLEAE